MSRQNLEREQRREGLVDADDHLTANPLLLRPDVITFLRTLLQERAIQWTMHCTPRDLDDIIEQMEAVEPDKRLRTLDKQQAQQVLQSEHIKKIIIAYEQQQQELHQQHKDRRQRIAQLQKELDELPRSSFLARWLSPVKARQYQDEVTARRATRLIEEIDRLQTELDNDIEPKMDPQWQFNNTHPTPQRR